MALWFPKRSAPSPPRIFNSGANVGAIVAPGDRALDRRRPGAGAAAFVVAGIAGSLWLLLWFPFYDVPERIEARLAPPSWRYIRSDAADAGRRRRADQLAQILRYRQAWSFIVAKFLTDPVWWFFLIWLPDYFKKTRGLDIKKSWVHLVTIYAIVTVLSIVGRLADRYLDAPRLERDARAQDRHVHLRLLRAADLVRDPASATGRRCC